MSSHGLIWTPRDIDNQIQLRSPKRFASFARGMGIWFFDIRFWVKWFSSNMCSFFVRDVDGVQVCEKLSSPETSVSGYVPNSIRLTARCLLQVSPVSFSVKTWNFSVFCDIQLSLCKLYLVFIFSQWSWCNKCKLNLYYNIIMLSSDLTLSNKFLWCHGISVCSQWYTAFISEGNPNNSPYIYNKLCLLWPLPVHRGLHGWVR